MQAICSNTTIAMIFAVSLAAPLPAQAATTDPEIIIYRFPGVLNNGDTDNTGIATAFHCTNFSGVTETVRIVVRAFDGTLKANAAFPINHLATFTASTHAAAIYTEVSLGTGLVSQGTAAIAATSINVICTAVTLDAASAGPSGFALRGIRFNPVPGSQE